MKKTNLRRIPDGYQVEDSMPILVDDTSLAYFLDLSGSELWGLLKAATRIDAGESGSLYRKWSIPKRSGGTRTLYAPQGALKGIQSKIRDRILDLAPKSDVSVAYRKGRCPGDTAREIAGSSVILKLDIKNFFPSITQKRVKELFLSYGYGDEVSNILGGLLCVKDGKKRFVCQGGTASPMLANRIAEMTIDPKVLEVLPEGWRYSRYCDNLYIYPGPDVPYKSGDKHRHILQAVRQAVWQAGFSSHQGSVVPYYRRQQLLGLTVNEKANMPRTRYKLLRACLHNCSKLGFKTQMASAIKLGFQQTGEEGLDVMRFKAFLGGLLNYYKDYLTQSKYEKLLSWYREAESLDANN